MKEINEILRGFQPISLEEMDGVRLMNRTDTKFLFSRDRFPEILKSLSDDYRVVSINDVRASRYESLYFDTSDFLFFQQHQRGELSRHKVRTRRYVDSDLLFFEIKKKNNKKRTIKRRRKEQAEEQILQQEAVQSFLLEHELDFHERLEPKMWVNYTRITLVNNTKPERVTLDVNLEFVSDTIKRDVPNLVIAEVKQDRRVRSFFMHKMRQEKIREGSLSKYCLGVISLFENIKYNNFKPKLLSLNKIAHVSTPTSV
ncbi:MAG: polyphosphate polymerase domain-containing protein [Cyclobacteriaceae bacterium]|nr:polyphosphate polymerase domain-containing protein [Cyclobacteriaceae bacterium]